ncbi:MAG: hypothetical protein AAF628_13185 [Planctomycetota bacterium]
MDRGAQRERAGGQELAGQARRRRHPGAGLAAARDEPDEVLDVVLGNLERNAVGFESLERFYLPGSFGDASYAAVVRGARRDGSGQPIGSWYHLAGTLAEGSYGVDVQCIPAACAEQERAGAGVVPARHPLQRPDGLRPGPTTKCGRGGRNDRQAVATAGKRGEHTPLREFVALRSPAAFPKPRRQEVRE